MCGFGIVETGLVSGSYYSGRGVSDINMLKTIKSTIHSVRTSQKTTLGWIQYPRLERSTCDWLFIVG